MEKINITVWNEFMHEKTSEKVRAIYPDGIHGAIAEKLRENDLFNVRTSTLDDPDCGLSDELLDSTDVLFWWAHIGHEKVTDDRAEKVAARVREGMGLIVLHSGHGSKPFKKLMGTGCRIKWRESGDFERLWVIEGGHPIASGLPEYIEFSEEETYGERFDIPAPDELVFISWFSGGEVFRSGCCYRRGLGKIFYFQPGHETYPIFHRDDVGKILSNAARWAYSPQAVKPTFGHFESPNMKED